MDAKTIGCKWVFQLNRHADGSTECYWSRIVAKGFTHNAQVSNMLRTLRSHQPASLRLILALAAKRNLHLKSVDISHAFLLGKDLEETINMGQPEGFHQGGPNIVCQLHKPLYSLMETLGQQETKGSHAAILIHDPLEIIEAIFQSESLHLSQLASFQFLLKGFL